MTHTPETLADVMTAALTRRKYPAALIAQVCNPKGPTVQGLEMMMQGHPWADVGALRRHVERAARTAADRAHAEAAHRYWQRRASSAPATDTPTP